MSDGWNDTIASQVINSLWTKHLNDDEANKPRTAAVEALVGIKPQDEIEGMIAAQIVACHNASMECYRRAMLPDNSFDMRHGNLNSANKLSRTFAALVEGLNRHRGKGQQKVTVEHVHVHEGGQAIVGNVETPGGGFVRKSKEQPHALGYAPGQRCRARTRRGNPCQSPAMKNGRCRMHGGMSPGAPKGNKNALKHGRYTAEAIARRRSIAELIRLARSLG